MKSVILAVSGFAAACSSGSDEANTRSPTNAVDAGSSGGDANQSGGDSGSGPGASGTAGDGGNATNGANGGDGGANTAANGASNSGSSGIGGTCMCEAGERCSPEGRCEPGCACDATAGACDEGCGCDYACGPANCAPFVTTLEHMALVTLGGVELWDSDTGLIYSGRTAIERRDGIWSHLRGWGDGDMGLVAMDSATSAWFAGNGIRRWKDGVWSTPAGFETVPLIRISVSRDGYGMAVGSTAVAPRVLLLKGEQWTEANPGPGLGQFLSADVVNGGDGWLTTTTHLVKYEAGEWHAAVSALPSLYDLELIDLNNGWARGGLDALYQLKDGVWQTTPTTFPDQTIRKFAISETGRGYLVTASRAFYELRDGAWIRMQRQQCGLGGCDSGEILGLAITKGLAMAYASGGFWTLREGGNTWGYESIPGFNPGDLSAINTDANNVLYASSTDGFWVQHAKRKWSLDGQVVPGLAIDTGAAVPWAAGEEGALARFDAARMEWVRQSFFAPGSIVQTPPTEANLYGIAMNADESGWAVGGDVGVKGVVLRRAAGTWTKHSFEPSDELHAIALQSQDTGWAVGGSSLGGSSVIARLNAGTWTEVTSPTTLPLWGVALDANGDGWAVGGTVSPMASVVLRLKNGVWSVVPGVNPASTLRAVAIDDKGYGWAVGTGAPGQGPVGVALYGDTATVCSQAFDRFASNDAYGVTIDNDGRTWVVGAEGFRAHSP